MLILSPKSQKRIHIADLTSLLRPVTFIGPGVKFGWSDYTVWIVFPDMSNKCQVTVHRASANPLSNFHELFPGLF